MPDHTDVTEPAHVAIIELPAGGSRASTREECEAEIARYAAELALWPHNPRMRRLIHAEIAAWTELAQSA